MSRKSNDEKGAISIFAAICIPLILLGALTLYLHLNALHTTNQTFKIATYVSDAQLSYNNAYMFETYGIIAYKTNDTFDQNFFYYFEKNKLPLPETIVIEEMKLSNRQHFSEAIFNASKHLVPFALLESLIDFSNGNVEQAPIDLEQMIVPETEKEDKEDEMADEEDDAAPEPEESKQIKTLKEQFEALKEKDDAGAGAENDRAEWLQTTFEGNATDFEKKWTVLEKIQIQEYLMSLLRSHDLESPRSFDPLGQKSKRDKDLVGEIEFLIAGKGNDASNLSEVKKRIFFIREITNLIHLTTDSEKMNQINQWTMLIKPPWNLLVKGGVILLWTGVESHLDVRRLMQGEGLSPIKTKEEWHLSLDTLLSGEWGLPQRKEKSYSKWYYQDYLRTLLYTQNMDLTLSRAMLLFEKNIRSKTNGQYGLDDFSVGHLVTLDYSERHSMIFENFYD